jgi:hypothetical protein
VAVATILDGQPASQLARTVLEQLAIGVDAICSRCERAAAQGRVIVLSDGQDRRTGDTDARDGLDAVVGASGQVDDDPIDVGQRAVEAGRRTDRDRDRIARPDKIGQAGRPDQVVGQDRDPGGQSSVSAR